MHVFLKAENLPKKPSSKAREPGCCAPARTGTNGEKDTCFEGGIYKGVVVEIAGGSSFIGTRKPIIKIDGEGPQRKTNIKPFRLTSTTITNTDFAAFIESTGYKTDAEKWGWSFVFQSQVPNENPATDGLVGAEWWRRVDGAKWDMPVGPMSDTKVQPDHPVVHVSWNDAKAYAAWVGGRLPTEAEWEHAARGGLGNVTYPWGNTDPNDIDYFPCNIWQGTFPNQNTGKDGYLTTAPARSFEPNAFGLFNMVGNVWQWTADDFRTKSLSKAAQAHAKSLYGYKVVKGGSFLCHQSYCTRYRIAARTGNSPESTTTHTGFRVAFSLYS